MNYYEMINQMVENSKLTLKELAYKCEDYGVKINPSYISKLKSGKQPPASDEVNKAIAKACGFEDENQIGNLLFEAYLVKAPEIIRSFLIEIISLFRTTVREQLKIQFPQNMISVVDEQINNLSNYDIIKQTLMINSFSSKNNNKMIELLKMEDDVMEPLIPKGATVHLDVSKKISNGDIIVVILKGKRTIRKYYKYNNDIFLTSEKGNDKLLVRNEKDIEIIGRVGSYTINL